MTTGYRTRSGAIYAQGRYIARGDTIRGTAPVVSLADGTWAIRVTTPYAAVATIPMPPLGGQDLVTLYGPRGVELVDGADA